MTLFILLFISLVILGYLMGSICSAVIVCRMFSLPDPREEGSQNPGATNVLRIAGKQYAALVLVADVLKGTIPVLIAKVLTTELLGIDEPVIVAFTALAAVVGHMYPVFFGFNGGKGVATAIGALLGLQFIVGVMVAGTWLLVAKLFRYSSLASIVAIIFSPFYALLVIQRLDIFPPLLVIVILILFKHRNNITRLVDGVEPKIKFKHSVIEEIMEPSSHINIVKEDQPAANEDILVDKENTPAIKRKAPQTKAKKITEAKEAPKKTKTIKKPTKTTATRTKKTVDTTTKPKKVTPIKPKPKTPKPKE